MPERRAAGAAPAAILALAVALTLAVLSLPATARAGVVPAQGQRLPLGTAVSGRCQSLAPPCPQVRGSSPAEDWGPDKDGTPFQAAETYSTFRPVSQSALPAQGDEDHTYMSGVDFEAGGERCMFEEGASELPLTEAGVWQMEVTEERYDQVYDSVRGWVSLPDDHAKTVIEDVRFEVTTRNRCGSPWVGIGPTSPLCLRSTVPPLARRDARLWRGLRGRGAIAAIAAAIAAAATRLAAADRPAAGLQAVARSTPARFPPLPSPRGSRRRAVAAYERGAGLTATLAESVERANGAFVATADDPKVDVWTLRQDAFSLLARERAAEALNRALGIDAAHPDLFGAPVKRATERMVKLLEAALGPPPER